MRRAVYGWLSQGPVSWRSRGRGWNGGGDRASRAALTCGDIFPLTQLGQEDGSPRSCVRSCLAITGFSCRVRGQRGSCEQHLGKRKANEGEWDGYHTRREGRGEHTSWLCRYQSDKKRAGLVG